MSTIDSAVEAAEPKTTLSLSAKGLTYGEISARLAEVYGANVSKTANVPRDLGRPPGSP